MATITTVLNSKDVTVSESFTRVFLVLSFALMTALGAYIRIPLPFTPVPITLQTFFVILSGAFLGKRLGIASQISYIALGTLGVPVFQGYVSGISHLAGPTGGYIVGFIASSFIVGILTEKNKSFPRIFIAMLAGLFAIYICGIAWLVIGFKLSIINALLLGILPFIPGAIAKLIAASWIYNKFNKKITLLRK
jgi:biotin transport system substrate-specific component